MGQSVFCMVNMEFLKDRAWHNVGMVHPSVGTMRWDISHHWHEKRSMRH
jgi:hypothetical protein